MRTTASSGLSTKNCHFFCPACTISSPCSAEEKKKKRRRKEEKKKRRRKEEEKKIKRKYINISKSQDNNIHNV